MIERIRRIVRGWMRGDLDLIGSRVASFAEDVRKALYRIHLNEAAVKGLESRVEAIERGPGPDRWAAFSVIDGKTIVGYECSGDHAGRGVRKVVVCTLTKDAPAAKAFGYLRDIHPDAEVVVPAEKDIERVEL